MGMNFLSFESKSEDKYSKVNRDGVVGDEALEDKNRGG